MPIIVEAQGLTNVGLERKHNEDSFLILPEIGLYLVADGMGGHTCGDVASRMAVDTIAQFFRDTESEDSTWPVHFDVGLSYEENRLIGGIQMANRAIINASLSNAMQEGMGTTVVALCFSSSRPLAYLTHVGDSRCYRIRQGEIRQLTRDHSLLSDFMQAMPDMSEEKKQAIPRNIITRALGMQPVVEIDRSRQKVAPGDLFLICSDGLVIANSDAELLAEIEAAGGDLAAAAQRLVDLANRKGGDDNVTLILVRVKKVDLPNDQDDEPTVQDLRMDDALK